MIYYCKYITPKNFDNLILVSDGQVLTNLFFENSKDDVNAYKQFSSADKFDENQKCSECDFLPIFKQTFRWLDIYFSGKQPDFTPPYLTKNLTLFRKKVQNYIIEIPWGKTVTYGDIAKKIATEKGVKKMSAQAVGGATGWNPICIIIPCHRVMGIGGKVTGYGGGIKNKIELLKLEGIEYSKI